MLTSTFTQSIRKVSRTLIVGTLLLLMNIVMTASPVSAYDATGVTISIPSIGVSAPIVSIGIRAFPNGDVTWDTTELTTQVGFLQGTAWFGQGGNIVLGGHSELAERAPSVFYDLDQVVVGDEIVINSDGQDIRYRVTSVSNVSYRDLSILYPSTSERLTIMTCDTASLSGGNYSRRDVVVAERIH
ncbi:MAG: sortase [Aggregatilineales bacterium]